LKVGLPGVKGGEGREESEIEGREGKGEEHSYFYKQIVVFS